MNVSLLCDQLHQYKYYSTGLLSTHDPFYEQHRHLLGPKKKKLKDEKKLKGIIVTAKYGILNIFDRLFDYSVFDFCSQTEKGEEKEETWRG